MNKTKMIQKVLNEIIGAKLTIVTKDYLEGNLPNKALFCKMVDSWANAWELQKEIYNKYQIDFSNYDDYLYYALEKSMLLLYGEVKTKVILSYLYNKNDINFSINSEQYFKDSSELYDYLMKFNEDEISENLIIDLNFDEDE